VLFVEPKYVGGPNVVPEMVRETVTTAVPFVVSVTLTGHDVVPLTLGVPDNTPKEENESPVGSNPAQLPLQSHVYGPTPLTARKVWE